MAGYLPGVNSERDETRARLRAVGHHPARLALLEELLALGATAEQIDRAAAVPLEDLEAFTRWWRETGGPPT